MYYPGRPPAKPWRISRNYAYFQPDKMRSEREWLRAYGQKMKAWEGKSRQKYFGNDMVMRREQRKQQRRLNAYLCRLDTSEWEV